jgi:hypothetical protein
VRVGQSVRDAPEDTIQNPGDVVVPEAEDTQAMSLDECGAACIGFDA